MPMHPVRLGLLVAVWLAVIAAAGCGGGGESPGMEGSIEQTGIRSRINGFTYPLSIYLPPASAGSRANLPIVYALDGDWWFTQLVTIAESTRARVIVVAIGNNANRAIDYVPPNSCTVNGGGQAAYFDFIRSELIPFVESTIGGDPKRRALLGHSHGGSFVYYALFAEAAADHQFSAYLASDASIWCMPSTVDGWEAGYAAANADLPVRVHVSHAGNENANFAQRIQDRRYPNLTLRAQAYSGGHTGMIPAAFTDALAFAFSK
jgi:enterochelin esterase-like enzyme